MNSSKKEQVNLYHPPRNWTHDWLEEYAKQIGTKLTSEQDAAFKEEVVNAFKMEKD